jgi:hypothetical protein
MFNPYPSDQRRENYGMNDWAESTHQAVSWRGTGVEKHMQASQRGDHHFEPMISRFVSPASKLSRLHNRSIQPT